MGIRKNAKFLSSTERENFVKACVLMKADIVNTGDPAASQYSKWDQLVAIHRMIQNANAPSTSFVNFGHGGSGSYSFLSWHRYFLYQFELQLQSYVPGVMLPYWDWTDPSSIMTDTFLGPNGDASGIVQQGYFAANKPGTAPNATALPAWWPASLNGWTMPAHFPATFEGGLQRDVGGALPSVNDLRQTLAKTTYPTFQNALESGTGLASGHQMHNQLHGYIGGHMSSPAVSPFDPIFYLHHCNIDRIWAMWQMDGHADVYPITGGNDEHRRDDFMYPWVGATAGYSTNVTFSPAIPMPDFSALGAQTNGSTLDFRTAYGYTYDTLAIVGVGLDQTGSMLGLTPDPLVTTDPDVTKWEAAKRGVSAFLQDCETVQDSGSVYVLAGIKTFRSLPANTFTNVFGAPGYGLIKSGTSFSKATFESNIAAQLPGGGTPLADALQDIQNTLVEPPFGGVPADEQRYLAMLTDGMLTSGSPMSSIADGSFTRTAVFGMGFGTPADVDYATIANMVAKGKTLTTQQVFHGENAGTINKFYENALAAAIGFDPILDPLVELFAGEHTHIDFYATSAEEVFLITAQGMDYDDSSWNFHLHGPGGMMLYGNEEGHAHGSGGCHSHCCPKPHVTARRANGRLTLVVQRDSAPKECWVGRWRLMISYKARNFLAMMMQDTSDWLFPVSAGPMRGPRYSRLLVSPKLRTPIRNIPGRGKNRHDVIPVSTNTSGNEACNMLVSISARTNLRFQLSTKPLIKVGEEFRIDVKNSTSIGGVVTRLSVARMVAPAQDIVKLIPKEHLERIAKQESQKSHSRKTDAALILAQLEKDNKEPIAVRDVEIKVVQHGDSPMHTHENDIKYPGVYHVGVYVEGVYIPGVQTTVPGGGHHGHGGGESPDTKGALPPNAERFMRLMYISTGVR